MFSCQAGFSFHYWTTPTSPPSSASSSSQNQTTCNQCCRCHCCCCCCCRCCLAIFSQLQKKSCRNLAEKIRTPSAMRQTGLQQQQQQQRLDTDTHNQNLKLLFGFAYSTVKPTAKSFSGLGREGSFICTGNCRSCSSRRKIPLQLAGILIRSLLLGVL